MEPEEDVKKTTLSFQRAAGLPQIESQDLEQLQSLHIKLGIHTTKKPSKLTLEVWLFLIRGEAPSKMSQYGQ